ncbi:MAG: hypothetical protein AAGH46_05270 [Bacteroidota bacterium]
MKKITRTRRKMLQYLGLIGGTSLLPLSLQSENLEQSLADIPIVYSYTELRSFNFMTDSVELIFVHADYIKGFFRRLPLDGRVNIEDGGVLIMSTAYPSYAWERVFQQGVDPLWWGLQPGSDSNHTDNANAIQPEPMRTTTKISPSKILPLRIPM